MSDTGRLASAYDALAKDDGVTGSAGQSAGDSLRRGGAPKGRRPGQSQTRQRILEAARRLFADRGFDHTTIRHIAETANVDPALVMYYFESKAKLFRAAIDWPVDMDKGARHIFEGDPRTVGERLVRLVCTTWEDQNTRHPLTVIFRNAIQHDEAARLMSEFIAKEMVARAAACAKDRLGPLRGALIHSTLVGLVLHRYLLRVEPLASASVEQVVRAVGPTIQRYLTEDILGDESQGLEVERE